MTQAKKGDTVRIHYSGRLVDGTEFDSSRTGDPLQFRLGASEIIPGLERQVEGMEVGTKATVTVAAKDAYGVYQPERVLNLPRAEVPPDVDLTEGQLLHATTSDGQVISLTIVKVEDKEVTLDGNHPLAGQNLVFDVELLEVIKAA